jgi:hypothetical protein
MLDIHPKFHTLTWHFHLRYIYIFFLFQPTLSLSDSSSFLFLVGEWTTGSERPATASRDLESRPSLPRIERLDPGRLAGIWSFPYQNGRILAGWPGKRVVRAWGGRFGVENEKKKMKRKSDVVLPRQCHVRL